MLQELLGMMMGRKIQEKKKSKLKLKAKKPVRKKIRVLKKVKTRPKAIKKIKKVRKKVKTVKKVSKITKKTKSVRKIKKKALVKKKIKAKKIKKKTVKIRATPKPKITAKKYLEDKISYDFLNNLVGKEGMRVVGKIIEKEVSDVDLAEKMDLKANIIRKHLYALYEAGVVTYRRHRSKTGWYTYYWQLHPERVDLMLSSRKDQEVGELKKTLEFERDNHFFGCKNKCTKAIFDEAVEHEFKCPKCEKPLEYLDNSEAVAELEKRISGLRTVE